MCKQKYVKSFRKKKENFVFNPNKINSNDLSLYTFLGVLMGVCIRANTNLSINLPSLLDNDQILQDIEEFDDVIISELQQIISSKNEEEFQNYFGYRYFKTTSSNQQETELFDGGFSKELTYENRILYARRILQVRMKECEKQCEAIKRALLNIVSYQELEESIYGKKTIDIEFFKRHIEYVKGYSATQNQKIKWFWWILDEMDQSERRRFIRFCWAQSTIPPNDEEFERRQVRFMIKPVTAKGQGDKYYDKRLTEADTYFFNFGIPKYSSKEIMKKQILSAITLDNVSLNADQENIQFEQIIDARSQDSLDSY